MNGIKLSLLNHLVCECAVFLQFKDHGDELV